MMHGQNNPSPALGGTITGARNSEPLTGNSTAAVILGDFYQTNELAIKNLAEASLPEQADLYTQKLAELFTVFLTNNNLQTLLGLAGDTDENKKARVLHSCITQPPIFLTKPYDQKDLFFAGMQTQLPLYTGPMTDDTSSNGHTNDPRLLESAGLLPLANNTLLLYSTPASDKKISKFDEQIKLATKNSAWEKISKKLTALCSIPVREFNTEHYTAVLWDIVNQIELEITAFATKNSRTQLNFTAISSIAAMLVMQLTKEFNTNETLVSSGGIYNFIAGLPGKLVILTKSPENSPPQDIIKNFCNALRNNIRLLISRPLNAQDKPYGGIFPNASPQKTFENGFAIGNQHDEFNTISASSSGNVSGINVAVSEKPYSIPDTCFSISADKHDTEIFSGFIAKNADYLSSIKCIPEIRRFILQQLWNEFTSNSRCTLSTSQKQRIRDDISSNYLDHCSKVLFEKKDTLLHDPEFLARCSSKATIDNKPYQDILNVEIKKELQNTFKSADESRPGFNSHLKEAIQAVIHRIQPRGNATAVQALINNELLESAKKKVYKNRDYFTRNIDFRASTATLEKINSLSPKDCIAILDDKQAEKTTKLINKNLSAIAILQLYGDQMPSEIRKKTIDLNLDHLIEVSQLLEMRMSHDRQRTIADTINAYYAANENMLRNLGSGTFSDDKEKQAELKSKKNTFTQKIILALLRRETDIKNVSRVFNDNQATGSILMPSRLIKRMSEIGSRLKQGTSTEVEILKLVKESIEIIIEHFHSIFPNPQIDLKDIVPQFTDIDVGQMIAAILPALTQDMYTGDHSFSGEVKTFISVAFGKFFAGLSVKSKEFQGDFYEEATNYLNKVFEPIKGENEKLNTVASRDLYLTLGVILPSESELILHPVEKQVLTQLESTLNIPLLNEAGKGDVEQIRIRNENIALTLNQQYGKINDDHWVDFVIQNHFYHHPKVLHCLENLAEKPASEATQRAIDTVALVKTYRAALGNRNTELTRLAENTATTTTTNNAASSTTQENYTEALLDALDNGETPPVFLTEKRIIDFIKAQIPSQPFGAKLAIEALLSNPAISLTSKLCRLAELGQGKANGKHRNRSDEVSKFYSAIQEFFHSTDEKKIAENVTQFIFTIKGPDFANKISASGNPIKNLEHFIQEQVLICSEQLLANNMITPPGVNNTLENVFVGLKSWKRFSEESVSTASRNDAEFKLQLKRRVNYCLANRVDIQKHLFLSMTAQPNADLPNSAEAIVNYMQELLLPYLQKPSKNAPDTRVALVKAVGSFLAGKDEEKLKYIESYANVIATTALLNPEPSQQKNLESLLIRIAAARTILDDQNTIKNPGELADTSLVEELWMSFPQDPEPSNALEIREHLFIVLSQNVNAALLNIKPFLLGNRYKENNPLIAEKAFAQRYLELLEKPNDSFENIRSNFLLRQAKESILSAFDVDSRTIDLSKIAYAINDEHLLEIAFHNFLLNQPLSNNIQIDFIVNYNGPDEKSRLVALFLEKHGKTLSSVLLLRTAFKTPLDETSIAQIDQHILETLPLNETLIQYIVDQKDKALTSAFIEKYKENLTAIYSLRSAFLENEKEISNPDTNNTSSENNVTALDAISECLNSTIRLQLKNLATSLEGSTKTFSKFFQPSALPKGLQSIVDLIREGDSDSTLEIIAKIKNVAHERTNDPSFSSKWTRSKATSTAYEKINEFLATVDQTDLAINKNEIRFDNLESELRSIRSR